MRTLTFDCACALRDAGTPPMVYSGFKGFPRHLFAQIEVLEESDQPGEYPTLVGATNYIYSNVCVQEQSQNKYFLVECRWG